MLVEFVALTYNLAQEIDRSIDRSIVQGTRVYSSGSPRFTSHQKRSECIILTEPMDFRPEWNPSLSIDLDSEERYRGKVSTVSTDTLEISFRRRFRIDGI